ncbi:hypothetical protein A4D02_33810 [Niastella koreensis]|uniref:Uncharacterized protein n=2 Tax=Niastella koreensis TaxID=354356 RepID=G8TAK9_NIAKG|nr:hypothetical protein [Niastella koreensis]AEV98171.1 hypothetical protein Niako_1809 [Niastella koreensis GR20-10]OQP45376.1 hypothetical protein A4D02_33810 [Niastella koreensis]
MKTSPFLINLFIYGPYVLLSILFIIFYYRAISFYGITKLKKFTVVMLGAFVVAFALRYFKLNFFDWVPIQFLKIASSDRVAGNAPLTNVLILLMMFFFVIAIAKIRTEKNARFLSLTWLLIGLLSLAFGCWLTYLYAHLEAPANKSAGPLHINIDFTTIRSFYLTEMIYPFLWVMVCALSLWKIKKEKGKLLYTK